jgi:hypothetical protein
MTAEIAKIAIVKINYKLVTTFYNISTKAFLKYFGNKKQILSYISLADFWCKTKPPYSYVS